MEVLKKNKGRILNYLQIILGCFITAFSVNCILVPNKLSTSGVTGLSQMAERFTGINYSYIYYVFSIIILIMAFFTLKREEFMKIIFVSFLYPTLLVLTGMFHFVFVQGEMFLVCIYFSLFYGLGSGIVLRAGVTFGGTDTVARILNRKVFKGVALSRVMLFLDGSILISLGFVFNKDVALYALVNHVICIYIMDYMLFGFRQKLYKTNIIPASQDDSDDITRYILSLGRGVTMYKAVGAYTKSDKIMLSSIISPRQSALIRSYLAEHFPNAFMEVSPIVTVYGTGERFVRIKGED
ncbi:MAG: YitT family protein [Oribacterium parvum]|uniref:YitT family protein n=1 Tax=Oribacterium parvum TaxID=1501329 RepID=UPI001CB0AFEB|nr:YitT family protein [Oribacterium parvum]MBF1267922.1 YitT family protein [Oribacterium parvum]